MDKVTPANLLLSAAQTMKAADEIKKLPPPSAPKQLSRFSRATEDEAAIALESALENPRTLNQVRASQLPLEKRYVFLSPMYLAAQLDAIPQLTRSRCILVFPCARESIFPPKHDKARRKAAATYMSPQFRKWVQQKEETGLVFFFKPDMSWVALSDFIEKLSDPLTGQQYNELLLDAAWWRTKFMRSCARYQPRASAVVDLFTSDSYSWNVPAIQELIYQSNPGMEPVAVALRTADRLADQGAEIRCPEEGDELQGLCVNGARPARAICFRDTGAESARGGADAPR
jgi:hypothetical protein